jgi:hypothetical protein
VCQHTREPPVLGCDGLIYKELRRYVTSGEIKANNTPSVYSAFDNDFTTSSYYRLIINDLDGSSRLSKIVYLDKNNEKGSRWHGVLFTAQSH